MYSKILQILQQYWGHTSFRPIQQQIINSVLQKQDTIALLPTGGGKSLCFQIPALYFEGVCVVISPLIALMQDQVSSLIEKGIKATLIPSGSTQDEIITLFDNIRFGNYKFLYLSPERLQSKFIQDELQQLNVSLIAIDEAHCISEWGHDFRPSYRNISILKEVHPNTPIIALTATATKRVIQDISSILDIKKAAVYQQSFYRENLAYQIYFTEDTLYKLKQIFTKNNAPSIVYVNSRNKTKEISTYLNANGFKSSFYHGGLSAIDKKLAFDKWMLEDTNIMVATNAFGMGIDKPNVKVVVHLNLPSSIENYVQEAGRGGRNGDKAFSVVLTNVSDIELLKETQSKSLPSIQEIKDIHRKLYQHFQIALGELIETEFDFNFLDFCNKYNFIPNKVSTTFQILINNGIIQLETYYNQKSTIQFLTKHFQKSPFIQTILRIYGGVFDQPTKIDEFYIAKKLNCTSWSVIEELDKLAAKQIINYSKTSNSSKLYFLLPREDDKTINRISTHIKAYILQKQQKIKDVIYFIENNSVCRSKQLISYFGESTDLKCGKCDVCLKTKNNNISINTISVINLLSKYKELSSKEICEHLNSNEANILILLRELLSEEKISINTFNKYTLL